MSEEFVKRNAKHGWLAQGGGRVAISPLLSNHSGFAFGNSLSHRLRVFRRNPMGQHSERLHVADTFLNFFLEFSTLVFREKHQTRLGAELARSHSERRLQSVRDFCPPFAHRMAKDEERVRASHLRVTGNRFWALRGQFHQCPTASL